MPHDGDCVGTPGARDSLRLSMIIQMRRDQGAALSEMAEAIEAMGGGSSQGEIIARVEAMLKGQALAPD